MRKKILFLTGTRADFGKLKSLINIASINDEFDCYVAVTGMHLDPKYGYTLEEIRKCGYKNILIFQNYVSGDPMDIILANTIKSFSRIVFKVKPDMIIIHGDRVETLAGASVGSLNNILTAHIEGGEVSGTIDELIRHAVSKMSHLHFVSNSGARNRLVQMGERSDSIFIIGSPDIDIMKSEKLPTLESAKKRYDLTFPEYAFLIFHPVVSELGEIKRQSDNLVNSVIESNYRYIAVYPNNDPGSGFIFKAYEKFRHNPNIKVFPSLRFEYFLTLLKYARFIIGNSSAGVREAPYYKVPSINIGTRQMNRVKGKYIINCGYGKADITNAIRKALVFKYNRTIKLFGKGNSDKLFLRTILSKDVWNINKQKQFLDMS